jgi:cytosine/adenosine deaminase-related metal-dependent hydrolase
VPYERPAVVHLADVVITGVGEPLRDAGVVLDGQSVAHVGPRDSLVAAYPDARTRVWRGIMTPGLVNAHTHLEYTDFADLAAAGLDFTTWLRTLTARRAEVTPGEWLESSRRGVHALLRSGTTCAADIVTHGPGLRAAAMAGLAGISYLECVGIDGPRWPEERARLERELAAAPVGRSVGISPHAPYTLGVEVFRDLVGLARTRGVRIHPHVAESLAEVEFVRTGTGPLAQPARTGRTREHELRGVGSGRSPVEYVDSIGGLGPDVHVAHGIHVSAADRALLRERATAVALCVRSNALLGAGEPPVADYLAEGSPLAVGTDSAASSPDLDLLAELAALRAVALRQGAPDEGLDERLVGLVTVAGAAALGLAGRSGVLVPGVRADLAVFDVPTGTDPYSALVQHGAGRCVATVVSGRLVHRSE